MIGLARYRWLPQDAVTRSMPHTRSPELLRAVVAQFGLATSDRYRPADGRTWCNIAAWDVTRALYAEVPHWIDNALQPVSPGARGARETTANMLAAIWMPRAGPGRGWEQVGAVAAAAAADVGQPALALWANPSGHGHVAVLVPRADGAVGVQIAQAGAECFEYGTLARGFGARVPDFWVHE